MQRLVSRLISLVLLGLSACTWITSPEPTPSGSSGIEGYVTEGPMCPGPISIHGTQCPDKPYQASISILNSKGDQIGRVESGEDGYFSIPLNPGTYSLHPESFQPFPIAADQTVEVFDGQYTRVSIAYDTGMR